MTCSSFTFPSPGCGLREESPALSSGYKTNSHITLDGPADFYSDIHNPGHYPSSALWIPPSPVSSSSRNGYLNFGSKPTVYPSPPPTSSRPGQSVPLPDVCGTPGLIAAKQSPESYSHSFADSPPKIGHETLKCREPFSPPPTLSTQTLSLPPMDYDQEMQTDPIINSQGISMMPVDVHSQRTPYLSSPPPSPEGAFITAADNSFSLSPNSSLFADVSQPPPLFIDHEVPDMFDPFDYHSYDNHTLRARLARRQWHPTVDACINDNSSKELDAILPSPQSWYSPGENIDLGAPFWDHMTQATSPAPLHILRPQDFNNNARLLSPPFPHPISPPLSSPASSDQDFDCHDYDDGLMTSFSPPSSPSLRSFSDLPMVEDEDNYFSQVPDDNKPTFSSLSPTSQMSSQSQDCTGRAPPIRSFPGVEVDADLIPIDLASRSSAPEHCIVIPSSPYITPSTLSLPPTSQSASYHGHFQSDFSTKYGGSSSSLLLYDDPQSDAVAGNSGLGMVLDQLNPTLVENDSELKWLLDLRTRVLASERQAKMVEVQYENIKAAWLLDAKNRTEAVDDETESEAQFQLQQEEAHVQMSLAMQAKKARKRERERLKEINALIKIKLKEKGVLLGHNKNGGIDPCPSCCADGNKQAEPSGIDGASHKCGHDTRSNKDTIASMSQLVARMILRRRESSPRPLTRPRHVRDDQESSSGDNLHPHGSARGRRRSSPLVLTAPSIHDQHGGARDERQGSQSAGLQFDKERCRSHYSPLDWHMDIDCHACSDSELNTLDDLDISSPFNLLSLSDS